MKKQALLLAAAIAGACPVVSNAINAEYFESTLAQQTDLDGKRLKKFIAWLAEYKTLPNTLTAQPIRLSQAASFFNTSAAQQAPARLLPPQTYTVKPGDYLSAIASQLSVQGIEPKQLAEIIYTHNPQAFIKGDKNLLKVGAVLTLPPLTRDSQTLISAARSVAETPPLTPKQELQQLKQRLAHSRAALAEKKRETQQFKLLLKQKNRIISKRTKQMQTMEDELKTAQSTLKLYQNHSTPTKTAQAPKSEPMAQGVAGPETKQEHPAAAPLPNPEEGVLLKAPDTVPATVHGELDYRPIWWLGLSAPLLGLFWWRYQSRNKSS